MQKRPRTQPEINEFRREAMTEATLRVIARHGYENATVERITKEAGVSRGLVNHYYASKDDLLISAYRALLVRTVKETRKAATKHERAMDRIFGMIETIFGPGIADRISREAYLAYWGASRANSQLRKATRERYRQYHRGMESLIARAGREAGLRVDADRLATSTIGIIDGMWLQLSLGIAGVTPASAIAICKEHLRAQLKAPSAKVRRA